MAEIPIILKLKKQMQKNLALAQDVIVKELFLVFEDAVLHGGTAIWRCYSGDRFSEDVDAYIPKDEKRLENKIFFLDFIIEAPFKAFFNVAEEWIHFMKTKKEEIVA